MSLGSLFGRGGGSPATDAAQAASKARQAAWESALTHGGLPPFVQARLEAAAAGRTPWIATMTPSELLLARSHGVRPVATVSGTCWYQYGRSWTEGHAAGWATALKRIKAEAVACGACAIVDVKMRTVQGADGPSMDFTLLGTAVRIASLPPTPDPVVATVPALEFVRLLEMGVVPVGLAVGARYDWFTDNGRLAGGSGSWSNQPLTTLGRFWEKVRRAAHAGAEARRGAPGHGRSGPYPVRPADQARGRQRHSRPLSRPTHCNRDGRADADGRRRAPPHPHSGGHA